MGWWLASAVASLLLMVVRMAIQRRALRLLRPRIADPRSSASHSTEPRLTLLTQNLWLHHFVVAPFRSLRIRAFLEHLATQQPPIDVVVIQEAFLLRIGPFILYQYVQELVQGMQVLGYLWWSDMQASLPRIFGQNSGVIVFSRFPLKETPLEEIFKHSDEILNCKGFASMKLVTPACDLIVIGTHLDSRRRATKELQLVQVAAHLKCIPLSSAGAVIVAGDFNTCPRSWGAIRAGQRVTDAYATLCEIMRPLQNATEQEDDSRWLRTHYLTPRYWRLFLQQLLGLLVPAHWPNKLSSVSLDHVFFSPTSLRLVQVTDASWRAAEIDAPVSDHVGVVAHFAYRR